MPTQINPAEYLLDLVNADFSTSTVYPDERVPQIQNMWARSGQQAELLQLLSNGGNNVIRQEISKLRKEQEAVGFTSILWTLLCRSFIKSHRDVLVYGVRLGMYLGLSILMGTVWIRMDTTQEYIQPFINAIVRVETKYGQARQTDLTEWPTVVLRIGFYVFYGCCLYSGIYRRF